jgi:hypothetical protein
MSLVIENANIQIKSTIDKQGFILINIQEESDEGSVNMMSFTVGMEETHGQPDLLFINESPENALKAINKLIEKYNIGLNFDEGLLLLDIDTDLLKSADVPIEVKDIFSPQVTKYYNEFKPDLKDKSLKWIGRVDLTYPFDYFLIPEEERKGIKPFFSIDKVN